MAERLFLLLAGGLVTLLAAGCTRGATPAADARYPIEGKVVAVDVAGRTLTIAHHDIPGFMPAMTMPFAVLEKDATLLKGAAPGDEVSATLVSRDSRYWLEALVVVRKGPPLPSTTAAPPAGAPALAPTPVGDTPPDVTLVDQDGRAFRLAELRGKAVALTFVFTRCPLPDYCPLLMSRFARAEEILAAEPRLRDRTRLITVSFDPRHDTPEVLRAFGKPFQKTTPAFTHWRLATGSEAEVRRLGQALDLDYVEEAHSFTHNLRTAVLGPDGRLRTLFRGNEWRSEDLVAELRAALP